MIRAEYAPDSTGLLAPLKPYLDDVEVSELLVNKPQEIYIEKSGVLSAHKVPELTPRTLKLLFQFIANENEQTLSSAQPLLSASLKDGARVQIVLPPTARYPTLSIRRKVVRHMKLEDYDEQYFTHAVHASIKPETMNNLAQDEQDLLSLYQACNWPKFIKQAIKLRKNIIISGGTSSGKTTFLNACLQEIPQDDRLIILEDTREIETPHPNQVQLLASKGDQGLAQVNMQDLVQCCLRLRPDRIIMGEIRGAEILDFISACSTGHEGSLTSIHANNPRIAFMRMTQMYKLNQVPSMSDADILRELNEVIDVIVQLHKTSKGRAIHSVYYKQASSVIDG